MNEFSLDFPQLLRNVKIKEDQREELKVYVKLRLVAY